MGSATAADGCAVPLAKPADASATSTEGCRETGTDALSCSLRPDAVELDSVDDRFCALLRRLWKKLLRSPSLAFPACQSIYGVHAWVFWLLQSCQPQEHSQDCS